MILIKKYFEGYCIDLKISIILLYQTNYNNPTTPLYLQ